MTNADPMREARQMAYASMTRRETIRAANAIASLREELDRAERRLTSDNELDRKLIGSSGRDAVRLAGDLAEATAALSALLEVGDLLVLTDAES
jgi:hypothetical protein